MLGAQTVHSAPVSLNDRTMDEVTAGNTAEGGGVVVGNSSGAVVSRMDGIDLSGEAQSDAKGLNIVNSTESAVANTTNIWEGSGVTAAGEGHNTDSEVVVNQVNEVSQKQARTATISGYSRSEADTIELVDRSGSDSHTTRIVDSNDTTAIFEETRISNTDTTGNVNTRIKFNIGNKFDFEGNLGQGVAVSGHNEIEFDGGSADIALVIAGGISVGADTADFNELVKITGLNLGDTGVAAGINAEAQISLVTHVELPKFKIVMDGAGCGVVLGSCNASSITSEITHTRTDDSTLDIMENLQSGQSSYSEALTTIYRSPFELKSARAEYIVIDDSTLELDSDVTLELSDSAQKDVKGMNIVNAIGSNVANGTNVSRTKKFEGSRATLVLNQVNNVHHGR